jgi:hypothetical protein
LHLVIVIDEVDKLTADAGGLATVEELLGGIKNVLTMPGVHFLLVAGPDLHDRAIRDAARGNGVYESVFGWRLYVPCTWGAPDRLVAHIISADARVDAETRELLVRYLRFKARGVPRRLLQELSGQSASQGTKVPCSPTKHAQTHLTDATTLRRQADDRIGEAWTAQLTYRCDNDLRVMAWRGGVVEGAPTGHCGEEDQIQGQLARGGSCACVNNRAWILTLWWRAAPGSVFTRRRQHGPEARRRAARWRALPVGSCVRCNPLVGS